MPPKYLKTIREEIYYEYAVSVIQRTLPNLVRVRPSVSSDRRGLTDWILPESNDLLLLREGLLGGITFHFLLPKRRLYFKLYTRRTNICEYFNTLSFLFNYIIKCYCFTF